MADRLNKKNIIAILPNINFVAAANIISLLKGKIILCDVPTKIYPDLEKSFLNLIHNSGHPSIKLEKKVDFNKLYNEKFS